METSCPPFDGPRSLRDWYISHLNILAGVVTSICLVIRCIVFIVTEQFFHEKNNRMNAWLWCQNLFRTENIPLLTISWIMNRNCCENMSLLCKNMKPCLYSVDGKQIRQTHHGWELRGTWHDEIRVPTSVTILLIPTDNRRLR
jgi:hypothetical protein